MQCPHLPCLYKRFSYPAVAAAVAGCDEVGHAAALQEGCRGHGPASAENAREGNHLHQAQSDHSCLCVVPEAQTVTETCADRDDVLQET